MRRKPSVFSIPPEGAFADRLAKGLLAGFPFDGEAGELGLARTLVVLPNRRAVRSARDAFVRAAGGALLLPRLTALGDLDDDLTPGALVDADLFSGAPAIDVQERTFRLMPLVERWQTATGKRRAKVETLRYAEALGRALDLMQLYEVAPDGLEGAVDQDMAVHWQQTAQFLDIVRQQWPQALRAAGMTDRVAQRQALLRRLAKDWSERPPAYPVIAAGIASAEPAAAAFLGQVARLPQGAVVLPGLDMIMPDAAWEDLSPADPHPQVPLKLMMDGMSVARGEVAAWPVDSDMDGPELRHEVLSAAFMAPDLTAGWRTLDLPADAADGLARIEVRGPAEEALAVALALRRALETPERTAALVTPNRDLARRVAAQMRRWGVEIDDSAGTPLSLTPPGVFLRLALEAAASGFAPVPLMALLKHPLAGPGEGRTEWLRRVRQLDLALRGVRPARGLQGTRNRIFTALKSDVPARDALIDWWDAEVAPPLRALAELFQRRRTGDLAGAAAKLRDLVGDFSDERFWNGVAGRAAADILADLERHGAVAGPAPSTDLPALLGAVMEGVAVRPLYGRHPRLAIYGLLEARLQRADVMILAGLSEGVWPPAAAFDPWLPPKVRAALDLPPTDRALALSAHDFVSACGAKHVLLVRATRDSSAPTVASRFWLRLEALLGDALEEDPIATFVPQIDTCRDPKPAPRPEPVPPAAERPKRISVTQVDVLAADPYQFYAREMLRLRSLDALGEDAGAAERGTIVHDLMETLTRDGLLQDGAAREAAVDKALKAYSDHPLLMALWKPRVLRMLSWAAEHMRACDAEGWRVAGVEKAGQMNVAGVTLKGKADVIFRNGERLSIADYKTGAPPTQDRILRGYADQLALLAWLACKGNLDDVPPLPVAEIAYWRLSGGKTEGSVVSSRDKYKKAWGQLDDYFDEAEQRFRELVGGYLTGDRPFPARLQPEFAPYSDYNLLARTQEWEGRGRG
ncbi:double-strand break repair protein AddB [Pacificimonas sp. ICDLI1SI03]